MRVHRKEPRYVLCLQVDVQDIAAQVTTVRIGSRVGRAPTLHYEPGMDAARGLRQLGLASTNV